MLWPTLLGPGLLMGRMMQYITFCARRESPTQSTRLTQPKHPNGMRSEVFWVPFLQKRYSTLSSLKNE